MVGLSVRKIIMATAATIILLLAAVDYVVNSNVDDDTDGGLGQTGCKYCVRKQETYFIQFFNGMRYCVEQEQIQSFLNSDEILNVKNIVPPNGWFYCEVLKFTPHEWNSDSVMVFLAVFTLVFIALVFRVRL